MEEKHEVRLAPAKEQTIECDCSDYFKFYVEYVCSCGLKKCSAGMRDHLFSLHLVKQ